jgi:hypothetical protein
MKLSDMKTIQKNPDKEKNTIMIWEVMQDARIVLLSKSIRFCESRRIKGIEFTILTCIFLLYRSIPSINGITLQILSLFNLVMH